MADISFLIFDEAPCQERPKNSICGGFNYQKAKIRLLKHINCVKVSTGFDLLLILANGEYFFDIIMLKLIGQVVPNRLKLEYKKIYIVKCKNFALLFYVRNVVNDFFLVPTK
jgi:hypothetical protein